MRHRASTGLPGPETTATHITLPARIADPAFARRTALADDVAQWSYSELLGEATAWRERLAPAEAGDRIAYLVAPGRHNVAVQLGIWAPRGNRRPARRLPSAARARARPGRRATPRGGGRPRPSPGFPSHGPGAGARGRRPRPAPGPDGPRSPHRLPPRSAPAPPTRLCSYTPAAPPAARGGSSPPTRTSRPRSPRSPPPGAGRPTTASCTRCPLHHVHGLVNALACALWSGAACEFGPGAPASTWDRLASGGITLFMSVPTVYERLIREWEEAPEPRRRRWSRGAAGLRLAVSGSAPLRSDTLARWHGITGHTLLERYGMTEIGMALSNPLAGERRPGHVGLPLPGVEVRIVDDFGRPVPSGRQG